MPFYIVKLGQLFNRRQIIYKKENVNLTYRPFHKTLPRSSAFCNWISVRFYETGCTKIRNTRNSKTYVNKWFVQVIDTTENCVFNIHNHISHIFCICKKREREGGSELRVHVPYLQFAPSIIKQTKDKLETY